MNLWAGQRRQKNKKFRQLAGGVGNLRAHKNKPCSFCDLHLHSRQCGLGKAVERAWRRCDPTQELPRLRLDIWGRWEGRAPTALVSDALLQLPDSYGSQNQALRSRKGTDSRPMWLWRRVRRAGRMFSPWLGCRLGRMPQRCFARLEGDLTSVRRRPILLSFISVR